MKARHITCSLFSDASLSLPIQNIVQYFISDIPHFQPFQSLEKTVRIQLINEPAPVSRFGSSEVESSLQSSSKRGSNAIN